RSGTKKGMRSRGTTRQQDRACISGRRKRSRRKGGKDQIGKIIMQSGVAATDLAVTVAGGRNDNEIKGGNIMEAPGAPEVIFERVKAQLKARLGAEVYSNWFGSMMLADCSKSVVRLSVPTAFL